MSNTTQTKPLRNSVSFAAIETYVERNMISPKATATMGGDRYRWGDKDGYPAYLLDLYDNVATLRSVIDGCVDFIAGDDVLFNGARDHVINQGGETAAEVVRQMGRNAKLYGGFALEVVRNVTGGIAGINCIDLKNLRTNKANDVFWYSEKWGKSQPDPVEMPAFIPSLEAKWGSLTDEERNRAVSSILWVKIGDAGVYPAPPYAAAVKACEIERNIDDYHLNSLDNGFSATAVINFNNGIPADQEKDELEREAREKLTGSANAGRLLLCWNDNKESATTVVPIKTEDFGDRYEALAKRSRQAIFTAFRANPNIFGIPTDSLGFSSEEYESAFKLFNRTQIRPVQRKIADAFAKIYGNAVLQIVPFTLEGDSETAVN